MTDRYAGDPEAAHPAPGTPVAVDPRDLVHALTSNEVVALLDWELG